MLKPFITKAIAGEALSADEMAEAVGRVMDGEANPTQVAALLVALRCKGETTSEIAGAARAMRQRMNRIETNRRPLIDTCGTGGSGTGSFNISTAVAFVVSSCGVGVAKHGNKAISSKSGSADVLGELGVNLSASLDRVKVCIEEAGIGFLFAPNHHPAMRHAGAIRRDLGLRTIFNVLGPLTNPAGAPRQLLGVFDRKLVRPICEVLGELGSEKAWVVHGGDGLDEVTVCDVSYVAQWDGNEVTEFEITPEAAGLSRHPAGSLRGGTPAENAATMRDLLSGGAQGPIRDAVILNTAAALCVADQAVDLKAGIAIAEDSLSNGKPAKVLESLVKMSTEK